MRTVLSWLTRPVPLARVAAFRALVYAFVVWDVLLSFNDVIAHSYAPDLYQPTLLARLVQLPTLSTTASYGLLSVLVACCVLAVAGKAQRVAGWGVAVTFWIWALNSQGFSYVQHDHMALMVATLVLPTAGVAHYRDHRLSRAAGWAMRCIQIATVLTYFGSVLAKWSRAGSLVTWANGSVLTWAIVRRGSHFVQWALEYPMLLRGAQWGSLALEILSPVVLFLRGRWLHVAVGCFLAFHLTTFVVMGIHFLPTVVCWFAFLPLEKVTDRLMARVRRTSRAAA